jgi:CO/xanthine dehydrogenase FAD-binding subunit/citrate lyase beta subunit
LSPRSLDEALRFLEAEPDLRPVAGCTDLMVADRPARARMDRVLDLLGVPELRGIRRLVLDAGSADADGGPGSTDVGSRRESADVATQRASGEFIEIGATTTFSEIARHPEIRAHLPALAEAAAQIGGWQIQNRATLGGNVANASPAGDSLPVLLALDAVVVAAGPGGLAEIPYGSFHVGYRKTALVPGQIVARVRIPCPPPGTVQRFRKVGGERRRDTGAPHRGRGGGARAPRGCWHRRGRGGRRALRGGRGRADRRRALDGRVPRLRPGARGAPSGAGAGIVKTSLPGGVRQGIAERMEELGRELARRYPGERGDRQPVHTVYGGAHLFRAGSARRLGELALAALAEHAPDPAALAEALGMDAALAGAVYPRVVEKLRREPVEDFRIDFEDGYGHRPDDEEDGHAEAAAREVAQGMAEGVLPPFLGIRVKPLSAELCGRSLRTLDIFLTALAGATGGALPRPFFVTLPKVMAPEQVTALADGLNVLEAALDLSPGTVRIEIMVETTQAIFTGGTGSTGGGEHGEVNVRRLADAGRGRCVAAHFGTYDYTAACNITAAYQSMDHPVCDFARHVQQVALAGSGVWISDGATNVLPVAPHRAAAGGPPLTDGQREENRRAVHAAWRLHYQHVRHSLLHAYYQGWDLHPAQLPTRYAAVYAFFLEGIDAASERLRNFVGKAAQATLVGEVFDDAATGQGLLNYFLRAINSDAISEAEAQERTGLTLEELRGRSFVKILERRRGAGATPA